MVSYKVKEKFKCKFLILNHWCKMLIFHYSFLNQKLSKQKWNKEMSPLSCIVCFGWWMSYNVVFPMSEKVLPGLLETCYFYSCTDAYCFWTMQRQGIFKRGNLIYVADYLYFHFISNFFNSNKRLAYSYNCFDVVLFLIYAQWLDCFVVSNHTLKMVIIFLTFTEYLNFYITT